MSSLDKQKCQLLSTKGEQIKRQFLLCIPNIVKIISDDNEQKQVEYPRPRGDPLIIQIIYPCTPYFSKFNGTEWVVDRRYEEMATYYFLQ